MDEATARAELELLVQVSVEPALTDDDLDVLLSRARRFDNAGNSPTNVATAPTWAAATGYVAGDVIQAAGRWWRCVIAGTSAATAPSWPDLTDRALTEQWVTDGDVTWVDNGGPWAPTWDLRAAARAGWTMRAGKASAMYDFTTDGQTFRRSMTFAQCMEMANQFRPRGLGSVQAR